MVLSRSAGVLAVLFLSVSGARSSPAAPPDALADLAIRGVTVLSPVDGSVTPGQTVLVEDDRIVGVSSDGEVRLDGSERVVNGEGLFVMPGLWDFHTHLALADANAAPLMVAYGVTGARDLGGALTDIDRLRDRIEGEELLGPRILRAGPTLNGAPNAPWHRVIDTPPAAREAVADLQVRGVDFLKTHNATEREPYFALLQAASTAGFDVVGHVPTSVSPLEACERGQRSVDHIATLFEGTYMASFSSEMEAFQGLDAWLERDAPALVECFAKNGTLFVPTLRTYEFRAHRAAEYDDPPGGLEYLTPETQRAFRETLVPTDRDRNPVVIAVRESLVKVGQDFTRLLYEAGAPIGAGTDFAGPGLTPGPSLHHELGLLVGAGLPEHAAIWASARGPGDRAGAHPMTGRIEVGAPADLVLLRENPFQGIEALSSIEGVIVRGRHMDRGKLDAILSDMKGP